MEKPVPSLRQCCFRDIGLLAALTWLLLSAGLLLLVRLHGSQMFDDALRDRAQLVLAFTQHEVEEMKDGTTQGIDEDLVGSERGGMLMQVWTADGVLAFRSPGAPLALLMPGGEGFGDLTLDGTPLRGYSQWSTDHRFRVLVAEPPDSRQRYAGATSVLVAITMLLGLAGFLWRLRRSLRKALSPLERTAHELAARAPGDLQPVPTDDQPRELAPVIDSFNQMIGRVQRALLHEQRFTADAAHELKTPLASLTVLLHNATHAHTEPVRQQALASMQRVVEQATHLVDQLLALARYDRSPEDFDLDQAVNLSALAQQVIAETQALAPAQYVTVSLAAAGAIVVRGNRNALMVLVRNLLDNATRHGKPQGHIEIVLKPDPMAGLVRLEVHDDGPGVPEGWHTRALGRFARPPAQVASGTGLGLAICERIVHLHRGALELGRSDRLAGTMAVATLPWADSGASGFSPGDRSMPASPARGSAA